MDIVIVGAGNVATILSKKLLEAGHTIVQVWSRQIEHATTLAKQVKAIPICILDEITLNANIYIIAVADNAIECIAAQLKIKNIIVVHTAGAISKYALQHVSEHYGVLYPLQSLHKTNAGINITIPFLIDASNHATLHTIEVLAKSISPNVSVATDEARLHLHVAAVIVNNFTNHLYALANNYCIKYGVDFTILQPLIEETAMKLRNNTPQHVQTGPAIRHDSATMTKHLQLLANDAKLKFIYLKLSESILEMK